MQALNPLSFFAVTPRDVFVSVGAAHIFQCRPKTETDTVTWLKDGELLEQGNESVIQVKIYSVDTLI